MFASPNGAVGTNSHAPPNPSVWLRCADCGWTVECLPADAERFVRAGCLGCGGGLEPRPETPVGRRPKPGDRRADARRKPRGAAWVEVRVDVTGPDLAVALADVAAEGLGVWLTEPVRPGEVVEVSLVRAAGGAAMRVPAEVRWCAQGADWTYRTGLRLSRKLDECDLADLSLAGGDPFQED
ncbi:MAG TPA: PilZ domain-containing protein [Gemmataceae bacterium]|nr:PilZ domain-containing protein [Gemmataceae bacterium]